MPVSWWLLPWSAAVSHARPCGRAGRVRTVLAALAWKLHITWKLRIARKLSIHIVGFISARRKVSTLTGAQARTAALYRSHRSRQHHSPHGFHGHRDVGLAS